MTDADLKDILNRIDRRGYPAYKDTAGRYEFMGYTLSVDHVQGDPFASPSKLSIFIKGDVAGFDKMLFAGSHRRIALEDLILRRFYKSVSRFTFKAGGSGKSGMISVSEPGQEILERSACRINVSDGSVLIRFRVGFPAKGRTVLAGELIKILFEYLPECVEKSLYARAYSSKELIETAELADDRRYVRATLRKMGLKAWIADGSVLPRESGISSLPMKGGITFTSPEDMAVELELPHAGRVRGMGIPEGITLIVGGGYHGKSTLLKALELGVYDHIKGDGRELVFTDDTAVKLRAEDGRSIQNTDISLFIRNLPNGKDTVHFSTEDASGSTSQAANTVEAIEAGSSCILIDEDTSATNFMIRDALMQRVVNKDEEPIIPFIDRVRSMYEIWRISTILVAGSSGSYFNVADKVIQMKQYIPFDITEYAKEQAALFETTPENEKIKDFRSERPEAKSIVKTGCALKKSDRVKIKSFGTDGFCVNREDIELRYIEQLSDSEQTNALSAIFMYLTSQVFDGKKSMSEAVEWLYEKIENESFGAFKAAGRDDLAMPRKQEVYAMLNRCRKLIKKKEVYSDKKA